MEQINSLMERQIWAHNVALAFVENPDLEYLVNNIKTKIDMRITHGVMREAINNIIELFGLEKYMFKHIGIFLNLD